MKTQNRIEELKERHAKELAELENRERIAAMLPDSLSIPTISNITQKENQPYAWLSFSPDYGTDAKAFAISVFVELEKAGFKPMPVSLCKWGNYRRSTSFGTVESIPSEKRGCFGSTDKLTDVDAIAPLWVEPCQFTGVEARAYYEKDGKVFKVSVKAPLRAHLSCRRVENMGGWRFDGACSVNFPQDWHSIYAEGGDCVANISQHTRGYRDTEQGISGTIYWQPNVEQSEFPLTPAQFIAQLLK